MTDPVELKEALHRACLELVHQRIENARSALLAAREAGNEETKSSAGDKYETGRAMMQQEQEKNEVQLLRAVQLKNELLAIAPGQPFEKIGLGCLALTDHGKFYLSIGLGKIKLAGEEVYAVSPASPIGTALMGKQAGEVVHFQGKEYRIAQVI